MSLLSGPASHDPAASPPATRLLGCGVMAGIGAAINTSAVTRGDSVAVIGCGGAGDAAVVGSRPAGVQPMTKASRWWPAFSRYRREVPVSIGVTGVMPKVARVPTMSSALAQPEPR